MRSRAVLAAGGVLALTVALSACSENKNTENDLDKDRVSSGVIATDPKDSMGPAAAVAGAAKGGTVTVVRQTKISHMDPQRVYSFVGLNTAPLYSRFLTTFKDDGKGHVVLVGDLAETPGKNVNNDCKVWEFKIKDGVKFEDGTPITSKEVAYGIARSFDPDLAGGPTYIQEWLADDAAFDKKWDFKANKTSLPPGLTTPDAKTLRFEFAKAHCDLPFAASLPATAPLPADKDKGVDMDNAPFSSGPYKLVKNTVGVELVFERNTHWDANTDPVRNAYPDKFVYQFGPDSEAQTNRLVADGGADQAMLGWNGVDSSRLTTVTGDAALMARTMREPTPSAWRLSINTQRVTDLAIRQALNHAIDRPGMVKAAGGDLKVSPLTTLMPPSTLGYQQYDAYPSDIEKAKSLLAGKTPELVLCIGDGSGTQELGTQLKNNLEKAGFKITIKVIPEDSKLDETKKKSNPWDLYMDSWAADWPSGASILPVLYDGRSIKAEGNSNTSYINSDAINAEFDRILKLDPAAQAPEWGKLDQRIMKELAPAVPLYTDVAFFMHGSKLGGLYVDSIFGYPAFNRVHVKQ